MVKVCLKNLSKTIDKSLNLESDLLFNQTSSQASTLQNNLIYLQNQLIQNQEKLKNYIYFAPQTYLKLLNEQ